MIVKPKPIVVSSSLPVQSGLQDRISSTDFVDCFSVESEVCPREAAEIITAFPGWAQLLLLVRRVMTIPFGLSNDGPEAPDKVGPFPVEKETDIELIAGFDDKHLDFRVSVFAKDGRVSLSTWVHPHNFGGRLYLKMILPFHILIARDALMRVADVR